MSVFINELIGSLVQVLVFAAVPFIVWAFTARKQESFFSWIGLKPARFEGNAGKTILIMAVTVLAYGAVTSYFVRQFEGEITSAGSTFAGMGVSAIPAVLAYGFIRTALSEELFFRGFLLKWIQAKFGYRAGNTVQALLFGALHGVPFGLVAHNILVMVVLTLLPAMMGYAEGWMNEKHFGGSILPGLLLHGLINTVVGIMSL